MALFGFISVNLFYFFRGMLIISMGLLIVMSRVILTNFLIVAPVILSVTSFIFFVPTLALHSIVPNELQYLRNILNAIRIGLLELMVEFLLILFLNSVYFLINLLDVVIDIFDFGLDLVVVC